MVKARNVREEEDDFMKKVKWDKTERDHSSGPGVATSQDGALYIQIRKTGTPNGRFRLYQRVQGNRTQDLLICRQYSLKKAKEEAESWVSTWKYALYKGVVLSQTPNHPRSDTEYQILQSLDGRFQLLAKDTREGVTFVYRVDSLLRGERKIENISLGCVYDVFFQRRDMDSKSWWDREGASIYNGVVRYEVYLHMCEAGVIDPTQYSEATCNAKVLKEKK